MKQLYALTLIILLSACGTSKTLVLEPVDTVNRYTQVNLMEVDSTVAAPAEVSERLQSVIEKGLFDEGPFIQGDQLTIVYRFISHDPGNQFARWFWGGIGNAGEGSITILVNFLDEEGDELAKTQVEGRIGSGFFGGSFNEAITRTGEDIVKFTIDNFSDNSVSAH